MNRDLFILAKCRIMIDISSLTTLKVKISQCCKKLVKMKSPSFMPRRLKSLWNRFLTTKTEHSNALRGNKRKLQHEMILQLNKYKKKLSWVIKTKLCIRTKWRSSIDKTSKMSLPAKTSPCCRQRKNTSVKGWSVRNLLNPAITSKKSYSKILKGNRRRTKKRCKKITLLTMGVLWNKQTVTKQNAWKQ